MLNHAGDRQNVAAIRLLLLTGERSSETAGLKWHWIRETCAVLPNSKTEPKTIQFSEPARAVLARLQRYTGFVFPNRKRDGAMADLSKRRLKLRALAGLKDIRIHDTRNSYASHAVMDGLDLYTVGRLLGHADTGSTERYTRLAHERFREVA